MSTTDKALEAYKSSYENEPNTKDVIWKVCELMASSGEMVQKERGKARYLKHSNPFPIKRKVN